MSAAITIKNLSYKYADENVISIDQYEFEDGKSHVLVGPNGSGKTTLLNIMSLLSRPDTGEISLLGEVVNDNNKLSLRKRIGYVQQRPYLFNMTVFDNIAIGLKLRKINKQLRKARTDNIIEQLNIANLRNKRGHELSGGEMQKVALARSLILEPEILMLDEPFTYLLCNIREHRSQTVIFSTHDHLRAHLLGDHVCSLVNSRLIDESSVNLFHGKYLPDKSVFDTGKIQINIGKREGDINIIAVEPEEIVLSKQSLDSSMRNRYQGYVTGLASHEDRVDVSINAAETFQVMISKNALEELEIDVGSKVWMSFKSSAVKILN
jgi:tungstate transport system ATP-binding protein